MPLRNVYTSLFSTGLHLQNSLLKVRQLEGFFEALEKCKYDPENLSNIIPNEAQLLEWLQVSGTIWELSLHNIYSGIPRNPN